MIQRDDDSSGKRHEESPDSTDDHHENEFVAVHLFDGGGKSASDFTIDDSDYYEFRGLMGVDDAISSDPNLSEEDPH